MPAAFARLHPRYRTPHVTLVIQSLASSAIFLASLFVTIAGRGSSIQDAYDIMVNLTILLYFVPCLYSFVAQIRLVPEAPKSLAILGFAATEISMAMPFVPPPGCDALHQQ